MTDLHLVYTTYGDEYGWGLSSPQLPELTGGRDTLAELDAAVPEIIAYAATDFSRVWKHTQKWAQDPEGREYLVRWAHTGEDRTGTAAMLLAHAIHGYDENERKRQPQLATTERLLVAVENTDTIGWCMDQLGPGGGAVFSTAIAEDAVQSIPLVDGGLPGVTVCSLDDIGLSRHDTVAALFDKIYSHEAATLAAIHV